MKNRKRLNNKGFTLIELLAVVVILAVVMGIAMSSVLSSMNNSKKGSLENSAESASQIFQNKYAETLLIGGSDAVLGVYNFTESYVDGSGGRVIRFYPLVASVAADLNLSEKSYVLGSTHSSKGKSAGETYEATSSFIAFDGEKIVACLVAQPTGSYYVGQAAREVDATVLGVNVQFGVMEGATPTFAQKAMMYACSNDVTSW